MSQSFTVAATAGATLVEWEDPARPVGTLGAGDPGAPSRLNPLDGHPHKMFLGQVGVQIEVTATVGGVVGPLDAALGGNLFFSWLTEYPPPIIGISHHAGQTSVQRFTPKAEGHHTFGMVRAGGGAVLLHFEVAP